MMKSHINLQTYKQIILETYESHLGMMKFPIYGKRKLMFQTTNHLGFLLNIHE